MTGLDLAAIILAVVALVAVAALAIVCARMVAVTHKLRAAVEDFERTAAAGADQLATGAEDLARSAREAGHQVDRLDDLIRTTGHLTDTVDAATSATFRALSNPVIKSAAIASGTSRAAKRLRRGTGS